MAKEEEENTALNLISTGTQIEGQIVSTGDIRIDGILDGSLETKGKVVIGSTGHIQGEIYCKTLEIAGVVEGKISVGQLLVLKSSSKITGDIYTTKLSIEPGAVFSGSCQMTDFNEEPGTRIQQEQQKKDK